MVSNFRQQEILARAREEGKVMVDDLSRRYDVTVQTIRRDLAELADGGQLERVHGGAVIASGVVNIEYEERRRQNEEGKNAIALACARAIPNGASVFMGIGTTSEAVAQALMDHDDLLIVTNNLNIANISAANKRCEVIVTGGNLRRKDNGLIGGVTAEMLRQFKLDYAVLGCSAIDADGDILVYDGQEVIVSRAAIQRARQVFIVADQMKFSRKAPLTIGALEDIESLFTDNPLPDALAAECARWHTGVVVARP